MKIFLTILFLSASYLNAESKVLDYQLVCSQTNTGDITKEANRLIAEGYQPLGSVSISISESRYNYTSHEQHWLMCQTMVKYAKSKPDTVIVVTPTTTSTTTPVPVSETAKVKP